MKYIVTFSGGKDSMATILWAKNNLSQFDIVFCDTGWEHKITYDYINSVEQQLGKEIIRLKSKKYFNFVDMVLKKGRFPSTKGKFCTQELKVMPMIDYILDEVQEDCTILQGIRNDESDSRKRMKGKEEYFKHYIEPCGYDKKGNARYHDYRKDEVLAFIDKYDCDAFRPILKLTANEVFAYIAENGFTPNPLYYLGMHRVGCFPCIQANQQEVKMMYEAFPEELEQLEQLEEMTNSTFFPPKYIPEKYCSKKVYSEKKGVWLKAPLIKDVIKYVTRKQNQTSLFCQTGGCKSPYNICE